MIDSMGTVYKVFDEKSFCGAIESEIVSNQQFPENYTNKIILEF